MPLATFAQEEETKEKKPSKATQQQEVIDANTDQSTFDPDLVTKPGRLKKFAKKSYKLGDYYSTVNFLEKYTSVKPDKWKFMYMLADSYRRTRDYKNAEDTYNKVVAAKAKKYPKAKFYLATMQKSNGFYEEADKWLPEFMKEYKSGSDAKIFKKLAKSEQLGAQRAKAIIDSALKVVITPLPKSINLPTMESTPIMVDENTIIYGSIFADVAEYYSLAGEDRPERKLYVAKKTGPLDWKPSGELPGPFNAEGYNVASGAYSIDGLRFYFTRCPKKASNKDNCAIWVSKFKDGQWQEASKLNEIVNMPEFNSTQPAVGSYTDKKGKSGDVLFFVSDREKGRGGLDIWYTLVDGKSGDFKKAKNLGSKVNSAGDDITPFYDQEAAALYFSSNGLPNIGGFDIFRSDGTYNKLGAPQNVGYPINSPADDAFFVLSKLQDEGYFVSNRVGGASEVNPTCCDDIYNFRYTDFLRLGVGGKVFEMVNPTDQAKDTNLLNGVTVSLMKLDPEDPTDTIVLKTIDESKAKEGYFFTLQYNNNYILKFEKDKYDTRYTTMSTTKMTYSDTVFENVGLKKTPPKEIYVPVIFFETNKSTLTTEQKDELRATLIQFMNESPDVKIKIKGHTDDIGNDRFNVNLSDKRAEQVYKFLVAEGVPKERFEVYGLGRSIPMFQPGVQGLEPEFARSRNRRVEFEIMGDSRYKLVEDPAKMTKK
ncbi:MAG: OmpA family protein [Bacteroidota bacterium]